MMRLFINEFNEAFEALWAVRSTKRWQRPTAPRPSPLADRPTTAASGRQLIRLSACTSMSKDIRNDFFGEPLLFPLVTAART